MKDYTRIVTDVLSGLSGNQKWVTLGIALIVSIGYLAGQAAPYFT